MTGGTERPPASVVLPTREWTPACTDVAAALRPAVGDELLVVCDAPADPVAERRDDPDLPAGVEVLVAGEPEGCSGKAAAVATAMERAENDRFVWTDADFRRRADWLDRLLRAGRDRPATVVPLFVGPGWWRVVEPLTVLNPTLAMTAGRRGWSGRVWAGGVTFRRSDLPAGVDGLVADLRGALSDDGVLSEHLDEVRTVRSRAMRARVTVPGDLHSVVHRLVRFSRIVTVYGDGGRRRLLAAVLAALVLTVTLPLSGPAVTAVAGVVYAALGVRRATFAFAVPALLFAPLIVGAGLLDLSFEWGGRRYRLHDAGDVDVLDRGGG